MSRRSRPSAAGGADPVPIPAYEPPYLPLSLDQAKNLKTLAQTPPTIDTQLNTVLETLTTAANDLGDRTASKDPDCPAKAARQEVLDQLEKAARATLDAQAALADSRRVLREIATAEEQEAQRVAVARRNRLRRGGPAEGSDDEDEADNGNDEIEEQVDAERSIWGRYKSQSKQKVEEYQALSNKDKYANTKEYMDFRRTLWDAQHEGEAMPRVGAWFAEDGDNEAADESSEEDFEIAGEVQSFKCPLTLRHFVDPVTSTLCPHSFEKIAIYEMIDNNRGRPVDCPLAGCNKQLTKNHLKDDKALLRKQKRFLQRKEREMYQEEGEEEEREENEQPRKDDEEQVEVKKEKMQNRNRRGRAQVLDVEDDE